jgi:predicted ATPase
VSIRLIKVAVTGAHSTGKTTFIDELRPRLEFLGLKVGRIGDILRTARSLGFPILRAHTFESTLWIMAECMRQEAEGSLANDVILVDRPVLDALGYLRAALQVSGREIDSRRLDELNTIVKAHTPDYDITIATCLDESIALGTGRDSDSSFRNAAADQIDALVRDLAPTALKMTSSNRHDILSQTVAFVSSKLL